MSYSSAKLFAKVIFCGSLLSLLTACEEEGVTKKDIVGKFCVRPSLFSTSGPSHSLLLSADGRYKYSITFPNTKVVRDGVYRIYGDEPVSRVELQAICFAAGRDSWCGDYPAQVLKEWGELEIILDEDAQGSPLILEKCAVNPDAEEREFLKQSVKSPVQD